ncbi:hypothetical protein DET60_103265 [Raoultella planticola]|nr:hypothetical protein DFO76_1011060 [Raoultella planticola]TDX38847.1 hypothetical protein DET60_103265 [Raoultella planticola]
MVTFCPADEYPILTFQLKATSGLMEISMLMSKAEYARHRGVSRQTVYDWVEKGEVVLSGTKIDVDATERQQQQHSPPKNEAQTTAPSLWPHRTREQTWSECWKEIKSGDGKYPAPDNDDGLLEAVSAAADELGYDVEFLEEGGIFLDTQDAEFYFQRYDLKENAEQLLLTLRRELFYTATECPDEIADWSPEGIKALSLWRK